MTTLLAAATARAGDEAASGPPTRPPNIVFVLLDAARADHFGCYGYPKPTTPAIDKIAAQGAVFLNAFAPGMQTHESMPLIMSSRYFSKEIFPKDTWRWELRRESAAAIFQDFDQEQIFLPELLKNNGYLTAIVHDHWWFMPQTDFVASFEQNFHVRATQPTDDALVQEAIRWIGRERTRPFFLYLHMMSPHQPYPPKEDDLVFLGGKGLGAARRLLEAAAVRTKFEAKPNESCEGWSEREIEVLRAIYDGNLRHTDARIGKLYSHLEKHKLAENTLFIVTADHAEHLGEHNHLNHGGQAFDSGIHIPLILVWPEKIPAGTRVEGLVELIDLLPTIADLGGLKVPAGKTFDGISLRPFLENPGQGKKTVYTQESIRTEGYKFIYDEDGSLLFNLARDPGEILDIARRRPELKKRMDSRLRRFLRPFRERYRAARKSAPPDYSFYLPLKEFEFAPENAFESADITHDPKTILKTISPRKPWVVNNSDHQSGLFYFPDWETAAPLQLSAALPDGTYRVSALVEVLDPSRKTLPGKIGLQGRFSPQEPFHDPFSTIPWQEANIFHLDWGEVAVKENRFAFELQAHSAAGALFVHLIRFDPAGALEADKASSPADNEYQKRKDGLRSLGYL